MADFLSRLGSSGVPIPNEVKVNHINGPSCDRETIMAIEAVEKDWIEQIKDYIRTQ